jgi:hypothetical protein
LGTESGSTEKTRIIEQYDWGGYREFEDYAMSEWIALEEGLPYYIEGSHNEWSGGDHFSASVEIEAGVTGHHH